MKINYKCSIGIPLFLAFLISACDTQRELEIHGEGQVREVDFQCGKVHVKAYTVSRNYFFIEQKYDLHQTAVVNKDSLLITYKGRPIAYKLVHDNKEVMEPQAQIVKDAQYSVNFYIDMPENGDTVTIKDTGYLYCEGKHIPIGSFNLIVRN